MLVKSNWKRIAIILKMLNPLMEPIKMDPRNQERRKMPK